MKKKATARPAKATSRQSTLNFPTSSEADLVAESTAAETSTKSGSKNRRKRTADCADDADKQNESHCDSSAISAQSAVKTRTSRLAESVTASAWPIAPLGQIAEVKLGKMLDKTKHHSGRKFPYLRNVNVRWGVVETHDVFEMYFEDEQVDRFNLEAGDVVVCEGGEPGRAAVWNGQIPEMKFQKAIPRVRFKIPFEPRLLVYFLEWLAKSGQLDRRFTGSTIKHFTRESFVQLPIPCVPISEQHRIVAEIEKQFTRLDAGVAALKRVQANLKRYRAVVLKAACEGKLVPTEAELRRAADHADIADKKKATIRVIREIRGQNALFRNRRTTPPTHPQRTPPKLARARAIQRTSGT